MKLISIVLATYNGEKYLQQQLDSISSQTHKNIELIIGDDNSSDKTIDILNNFSTNYPLKVVLSEQNIGFVKNFERILSMCSGDYIAFCDQDDVWLPNKLEVLIDAIKDYECVHSDAFLIDQNGRTFSQSYSNYSGKICLPNRLIDLAFNGCVTGCTMLVKRSLVMESLPFPEGLDVHDRWIGALSYSRQSLAYVEVPLIKYRQHQNNSIGAFDVNRKSSTIVKTWLNQNYKNLFLVKQKFFTDCHKQSNFLRIFSKRFRCQLADKELRDLNLAENLFGRLSRKECSFRDLFIIIKLSPYFNVNKPNQFRLLYMLSLCRIVLILSMKKGLIR